MQKLRNIPLSLYIHLPWCIRKCPYCDFNSHEAKGALPFEVYAMRLMQDLDENLERVGDRSLISIFFGGGTPSLFPPAIIASILKGVEKRLPFDKNIEITMEANPGTLDEANFRGFFAAGVNRLSLGIQSFQDDKLKVLGRIHGREHAIRAIELVKKIGFTNFNLDLMHGLPNQTLEDALSDLQDALAFNPPHLSWYQLTIEPNTFFHYQPPALPQESILWDIQDEGKALLIAAGLNQYEVSAYSKKNYNCQHNLNYWEFGDYLGIGAGAHSKLSTEYITRHWQVKNPKDYIDPQKRMTANCSTPTESEIIFEFMLNALRLTEGISMQLFKERTGLSPSKLQPTLNTAIAKKLLENNPDILLPTPLGQRFLNNVIEMFLTA